MAAQNSTVEEPEFISYLLSSKLKHDCVFLVGNKNHMQQEKIGVVKAMLMAHSIVLRLELEDSKLAEKGVVMVTDIYPDTFRTLLRYVYGHDTTAALCFDDADNLLYVAEKYMMEKLKKKLSTRLMSLLNTENICSLLNNPACYKDLELNSAITEILRYETDRVLASPMFLGLSPDGFAKILEQDGLVVPEIDLWRATMKWAKHNADSEDGNSLRKQVSSLTRHIKICTLSTVQFCEEVAPSNILTNDEIVMACISIGKKEKAEGLTEFCNDIIPRAVLQKSELQFTGHGHCCPDGDGVKEFNFTVATMKCDIELLPLECLALDRTPLVPAGATYGVSCTTTITRVTNHQNDTSTETPVTVRFNKQVEFGTTFKIPIISGGHNMRLLHNSKYTFRMAFEGDQPCFYDEPDTSSYDNSHLSVSIEPHETWKNVDFMPNFHFVPMTRLKYGASKA